MRVVGLPEGDVVKTSPATPVKATEPKAEVEKKETKSKAKK